MLQRQMRMRRTGTAVVSWAAAIGGLLGSAACGGNTSSRDGRAARPAGGEAGLYHGGGAEGGHARGGTGGDGATTAGAAGGGGVSGAGSEPTTLDPVALALGGDPDLSWFGRCAQFPEVACPVADHQSGSSEYWRVLVESSTHFDPETRFLAMDKDYLLVRRGDGSFEVALLTGNFLGGAEPVLPQPFPNWRLPDADLEPRAIACPPDDRVQEVLVLACHRHEGDCLLLWGDTSAWSDSTTTGVLTEVGGSTIPDGFLANGLVADPITNRICAYGNGMICFDQRWQEVIPSEDSLELRGVVIAPWRPFGETLYCSRNSAAVANDGRWWIRAADRAWEERAPLETDLRAVGYLRGTDDPQDPGDPTLVLMDPEQLWLVQADTVESCPLPDVVAAHGHTVVQGSGRVLIQDYHEDQYGWGEISGPRLAGDPLGATTTTCLASGSSRIFTESQVIGQDLCFVY